MDLREYFLILRRELALFSIITLIVVVGALIWQKSQPETYEANLLLNVGRSGGQVTSEYSYDSFYRLQADERFADTVVRWLGSPRVAEDIASVAKASPSDGFTAKRLSSQVVEVTFVSSDKQALEGISDSLVGVLNRYTESLNREKPQNDSWFTVIGSDPVIRDARVPLVLSFWISIAVGLFIAFWVILFKHYFRGK